MKCKTTQWILWAFTMILFCWLAFHRDFDRLAVAMIVSSLVWYTLVPGTRMSGCESAIFDPIGVAGRLYWYGIYPLHVRVFAGLLRAIAARASAPSR